jgi:hypothetical protein
MTTGSINELRKEEQEAVARWKLGHHLFHLHLAAMNSRLDESLRGISDEDWAKTTETFTDLTILYYAATSSMKYAAAFSRSIYEDLIRPSMSQPYLSPGFSGRLNPEHVQMLEKLTEVRQLMRDLLRESGRVPESVADQWGALVAAQRANRRQHMIICERFVAGGQSLLREFWDQRK